MLAGQQRMHQYLGFIHLYVHVLCLPMQFNCAYVYVEASIFMAASHCIYTASKAVFVHILGLLLDALSYFSHNMYQKAGIGKPSLQVRCRLPGRSECR